MARFSNRFEDFTGLSEPSARSVEFLLTDSKPRSSCWIASKALHLILQGPYQGGKVEVGQATDERGDADGVWRAGTSTCDVSRAKERKTCSVGIYGYFSL